MIKKLQILWYLKKDDFINYAIDFKPYNNKIIEGYELSEVDEDLIYDLADKNPDELNLLGFFHSENELKRNLKKAIEKSLDSEVSEDKLLESYELIEWTGEDYYISYGSNKIGENKVLNWYDALKEEYSKSLDFWIMWITGYDIYDLAPTRKTLIFVLSDILNLQESYFDEIVPKKARLEKEEWNKVIKRMEKKYHFEIGLKRVL